jgi:hypothetical protein
MDINDACHLLDIEIDHLSKLTKDDVKKKFHKSALKHHPDKNGNTLEATIKFQQINEGYRYLVSNLDFEDQGNENENENGNGNSDNIFSYNMQYMNLLNMFIGTIIKGTYKEILINILQEIMKDCKEISNKLFEDLDRDTSLEIYHFLCKYKNILYVSSSIIENIRNIIIEKFSKDNIFILNPSLIDLFENNIYKLIINEQKYLVPLWHNELYFDGKENNDIIVFCIPDLPDNINIDENNNLLVELKVNIDNFINFLESKYISFILGNKSFEIPLEKLLLKKTQIYIFYQQGISQIIENKMYDTNKKSDIIVTIIFT